MGISLRTWLQARRSESLRHALGRYGAAIAVVVATVLVRLLVEQYTDSVGFALFLIGILAAAWVGGVVPGLLCQTLFLFAQRYMFGASDSPSFSWTAEEIFGLVAFYSVGGLVGALSEAWRGANLRAKAEASEAISQREQLRATIGCVADGVLVTDANGRVTLMNPVAEAMTGWTLADSRGKPVRDVFTILDQHSQEIVENPVSRALRDGQALRETVTLLLTIRNDRRLPIAISAAPIQDARGKTTGVVLILRDETERFRNEEALHTADRLKDEFLATLAHELRNPLAPICMGLELMKHLADDPAQAEDVRAMMERQSNHMVRLIDELLDVSRISRGKLELRLAPAELNQIVQNAVDACRPLIDEAGHQLVVSLPQRPVLVYVDPHRMTQVMSNLLNNAAKFTPHGGIIDISAHDSGAEVVITVSDTGVGVPADMKDLIFEMFTQVRDMEAGHKGLGIGLTLVKRLVELHGGTVDVESDGRNQGSRFHVRLPASVLCSAPHVPGDSTGELHPSAVRRRVLVVDDNADALKALSMLVTYMGHDVREARDGVNAVEMAAQFLPEVVLMDIGMPNLNGYDAAKRIRREPWGRDMVLIATTGWGQEDDRERTLEAGFDRHLVKPIEHAVLQSLLDSLPRRAPGSPSDHDTVDGAIYDTAILTAIASELNGPHTPKKSDSHPTISTTK